MNDEIFLDRELKEMLAMLKTIERKMVENENFSEIKDIFAIHLAVLQGSFDMSDALEFVKSMYVKDGET